MSQQTHIKTNTHKIFLVIIFCLVLGFGFGKGEKAEAITNPFSCSGVESSVMGECFCIGDPGEVIGKSISCVECNNALADIKYKEVKCFWKNSSETFLGISTDIKTKPAKIDPPKDSCSGASEWGGHPIDCSLLMLLNFFIWLMTLASTIFGWIMIPESITGILSSTAIYNAWMLVRDTLNVFFIMFLLFSAFATVFQVDKYSYKKIWLNMLLMTLLVNFSFPISRFIIDISNMMMFYFASALDIGVKDGAIMTSFASVTKLPELLHSQLGSAGTALLASTIFVFVFTVTILTISVLFLIRTIALAILIVFSSLAFVGMAIPPLSSYASDWWKKLFSYAFFGPVMLFMMYIASYLMTEVGKSSMGDLQRIAAKNSSISEFIATMSFSIIPIVILWMGLGIAQSMSIAGAGAVVGKAQGFMKGAGKWASGAAFVGGAYKAYQSRRAEAGKDSWRNRLGTFVGSKQDQLRGVVPGRGGRDAQLRYERDLKQKVDDETKRRDTVNASTGDLQALATTGNRFERAAAIQELANRGQATAAQLQEVGRNFGETSQVFSQLVAKVKAYDPIAAFSTAVNAAGQVTAFNQTRLTEHLRSNQFDAKKLNANSLGNADFMELAFQEQAISNTDLEDLRKKSIGHESNIRQSLGTVANRFNYLADTPDPDEVGITDAERTTRLGLRQQQRINRNVQMSYFAQTGNIHDSIEGNPDYMDQIFSRLNKDTMKRITADTADTYYDRIAENMTIGKYKEALTNIENRTAQRSLNGNIMSTDFAAAGNAEAEALRQSVLSDPRIRNIQ